MPSNRPTKSITRSTKSISIHHSQSSQSISIYDREIGAKISVSVSISRFLRQDILLYGVWCGSVLTTVRTGDEPPRFCTQV